MSQTHHVCEPYIHIDSTVAYFLLSVRTYELLYSKTNTFCENQNVLVLFTITEIFTSLSEVFTAEA